MIAGMFLLTNISSSVLNKLIAVLIFIFVGYRLIDGRIQRGVKYIEKYWHGVFAGFLAGFASTVAHAAGPPLTIFLLLQNLSPPVFVATSAIFVASLNAMKLPLYFNAGMIDFRDYLSLLFVLPLIPLGVLAGKRLVNWINKELFEKVVTFWLFVSGLIMWINH